MGINMGNATNRTYLDADSHIMELPDFLTSNAPQSQLALVPRVPVEGGARSSDGFELALQTGAQPPDKVQEMVALGNQLISGPKGYFALGAFNKTVEVNIRGYFFMSIEAGKMMRDNGGGAIVNTASISALQPGPMQGIYSITKAAVANMTKVFAKECAPLGIRCNALLPGLTKTKFAGALFDNDDIYKAAVQAIPMGRHAEPSEMAGTVLYLVSDASSYTNGECIVVDGGMTL